MHLGDCPLDVDVMVLAVDVPDDARLRLWEVGLHVGAVVRVTHRGPSGGRVVAVGGSRLALDAETARRVPVAQEW